MNKKNKRNRGGAFADSVRVDIHDFLGRLIDRTKCKTTEKGKGLVILEKLEGNFQISEKDRWEFREKMFKEQCEFFNEDKEKISWTRDSKGRIISPFSVLNKKKDL